MAAMPRHRLKSWYYALTAANTLATNYYLNYLFFYLRDRFGFTSRDDLAVAALHGGLYVVSAWQGGRFAERRGYPTSLLVGFGGLALCMVAGAFASAGWAQLLVLAAYTMCLLCTWPALEALTVQHEPPSRVPHMIGVYNCTWSGAAAIAYFTGGALYGWLGGRAVFWLPAAIFAGEFLVMLWLKDVEPLAPAAAPARWPHTSTRGPEPPMALKRAFLRLAWLANPFSYVAVYTLLAIMPAIGERFGLSPAGVGLFCSIWFFGRLAAFAGLWQWVGWHYRFDWLLGGYLLLVASFAAILLAPVLWLVVLAEIVFGAAAGLVYYSSIFYSLDASDAKAEHGGFHEAAIGAGICAGPAVGAASLSLFPGQAHAGAAAVSTLLIAGLGLMLVIWRRSRGAA